MAYCCGLFFFIELTVFMFIAYITIYQDINQYIYVLKIAYDKTMLQIEHSNSA
jgi:hypothetical protein